MSMIKTLKNKVNHNDQGLQRNNWTNKREGKNKSWKWSPIEERRKTHSLEGRKRKRRN